MTQNDIETAFKDKVVTRSVADHTAKRTIPQSAIVLETFADGGELWIDTPTFLEMFGALEITYASLSSSPLAASTSWGKYFDNWKAQGIIS